MDLIPVKIKKHVRSNFAGKYDSKQLEFLTSIVSAGKPRISPVLSNGIFGYLQKHGLIEVKASLTEKGRWVATAYSLHISFFTLSALADFYCMQKATGFAVSPKFMERLNVRGFELRAILFIKISDKYNLNSSAKRVHISYAKKHLENKTSYF